jgi:AbrB family looped-hinge helix DNA binding protein
MVSTIDSAGRVVIPKQLRTAAGLVGGQEIEIKLIGDRIEISATPRTTRLKKNRHGILVAEVDGLSVSQDQARDELERQRR